MDTVLILGRPSSRLSVVVASSTTSLASQTSTTSLASLASTSSSHSKDSTYANVRPTTKRLQVYRTPIPTSELILEDLNPQPISGSFNDSISSANATTTTTTSGAAKHGSFKSAFSASSGPCKNGFRVSFRNPSDGQSHTLFAPDEHSKKTWITALRKVSKSSPLASEKTICETDTSSVMNFGTPNAKRLYSINGKVAKNSPRIGLFQKNGTNQRSSPRIKASLSHTALESVRSGGAMKKMRSTASSKKLQLIQDEENRKKIISMSAVNLQSTFQKMQETNKLSSSTPPPTPPPRGLKRDLSQGSLVAAAVGRRIVRQQLNSCQSKASPALKLSRSRLTAAPPPLPPKSGTVVRKLAGPRKRNKSWGHLQQV